jgi:hypothetical protein
MNGFAPLIEGFLAFALTMLALTTGVSAIVGAIHHLRRLHARGLRDMVRLLYLREIVSLLDGDGTTKPASGSSPSDASGTAPPNTLTIDAGGRTVVVDMSAPVPSAREKLGDAMEQTSHSAMLAPLSKGAQRAEFIYDMTFMPLPVVVERLETKGKHYWREKLQSAEKLADARWYHALIHWKRLIRYWVSLRYSLECLQDGEFRERFASSDVGVQLQEQHAWEKRGLPNWDALVEHLLKKFRVIGAASSETFARHSRAWCVAVGFLLAAMLNIDSLDLLNSYLTDPGLRQRVLDRSDAILAQETPAAVTDVGTVTAPARTRFDAATAQLTNAARDLSGTLEIMRSNAAGTERDALAKNVASQLENVAGQMKAVQVGVNDLEADVTLAEQRIRGVTRSLTASFPIGWKRFPNCSANDSPDVRCQGRTFAHPATEAVAPVIGLATMTAAPRRWSSVLLAAQAADPDAFNQWVVGVMLTGLLLGLGTPFWVQAVSAAFSLRRWDPKTVATNTANAGDAARHTSPRPQPALDAAGADAEPPAGARNAPSIK